jgi:hypothetical protein
LLPGLRDLRTPLAVGYLWVVVLWLLVHSWVPKSVKDVPAGPVHSLYELGAVLGAPVIFAAISFIAYLLGTLFRLRIFLVPRRAFQELASNGLRAFAGRLFMFGPAAFRIPAQLRTFVSTRLRETASDLPLTSHAEILNAKILKDYVGDSRR